MEYQTAEARYEKTWNEYLSELGHHPTLRLAAYLRFKHVYQRGFVAWMSRNGYSVRAVKERLLNLKMEAVAEESTKEPAFLPVSLNGRRCNDAQSDDALTGISLTLPDGTVISIRRGSAEAVVSFLKLYSGEAKPCSD